MDVIVHYPYLDGLQGLFVYRVLVYFLKGADNEEILVRVVRYLPFKRQLIILLPSVLVQLVLVNTNSEVINSYPSVE